MSATFDQVSKVEITMFKLLGMRLLDICFSEIASRLLYGALQMRIATALSDPGAVAMSRRDDRDRSATLGHKPVR